MSLKVGDNLVLLLVITPSVKCQLATEMGHVGLTLWIALLLRYEKTAEVLP